MTHFSRLDVVQHKIARVNRTDALNDIKASVLFMISIKAGINVQSRIDDVIGHIADELIGVME